MRVLFCQEYDTLGKCIKCKWNQAPSDDLIAGNDNIDPSVKIYKDGDRLALDYGLYGKTDNDKKCYDNKAWDNSNRTPHCAKYTNDAANPKCAMCHYREFDFDTNREWTAPSAATSLAFFRKIHLDYYISEEPDGKIECKRYPAMYAGRPFLIKRIVHKTDTSVIDGTSATAFTCKDKLGGVDYIPIRGCGELPAVICAGSDDTNNENSYFLCATKIDNCEKYLVEDKMMDRFGEKENAKPSFWYKVAEKCVRCKSPDFKPD